MISVIITGTTGMVGEGVLHECLNSPLVSKVLSVGRKSNGVVHPKHKELIVSSLDKIAEHTDIIREYNVCLFCAGISSIGKTEEEYTEITYTATLAFARAFLAASPGSGFQYISGKSTDSTEKGKVMWARVKGRTENEILNLGFSRAFAVRPGYLHPTPGLKNTLKYYKYITPLYPVLRVLFPGSVSLLSELGLAMIEAAVHGYSSRVLEVKDIKTLASLHKSR